MGGKLRLQFGEDASVNLFHITAEPAPRPNGLVRKGHGRGKIYQIRLHILGDKDILETQISMYHATLVHLLKKELKAIEKDLGKILAFELIQDCTGYVLKDDPTGAVEAKKERYSLDSI